MGTFSGALLSSILVHFLTFFRPPGFILLENGPFEAVICYFKKLFFTEGCVFTLSLLLVSYPSLSCMIEGIIMSLEMFSSWYSTILKSQHSCSHTSVHYLRTEVSTSFYYYLR
jgi:hypothetical protein